MIDFIQNYLFAHHSSWTVILQVFIVIFLTAILNFIIQRIAVRLYKKTKNTANWWDDALIAALRRPIRLIIWLAGVSLAAEIVHQETGATIFEAVGPLRDLGIIIGLAWFLIRFTNQVETAYVNGESISSAALDRTTIAALSKLLRLSIAITSSLVALQTLGFSIAGVLAFGGSGGIAGGFASKVLLANCFGSIIVYLDRPFREGDWIKSPDKDIEGTVESIGWRMTRIRKFDRRPIYVPNSVFTSITIENPSRMTHRRIYEVIGVRYDDTAAVQPIVEDVTRMLYDHPGIATDDLIMVNLSSFSASSVDFLIYAFTQTTIWTEYNKIRAEVLFQTNNIIERHGAQIAYPTQTLHIPELEKNHLLRNSHIDPQSPDEIQKTD